MNEIKTFIFGFFAGIVCSILLYGIWRCRSNKNRVRQNNDIIGELTESVANNESRIEEGIGQAESGIAEAIGILETAGKRKQKK